MKLSIPLVVWGFCFASPSYLYAQSVDTGRDERDDEGEGEGEGSNSCSNLGTAYLGGPTGASIIGRQYDRNTGSGGIVGGSGSSGPVIDPGLSINYGNSASDAWSEKGVLTGSSMRLQDTSTGGHSGITYNAVGCVTNTSITQETWGGSSRGFWDTDTGVSPGSTPSSFNDPTLDNYTCWGTPLDGSYDFVLSMTVVNDQLVDGVYFEQIEPGATGGLGGGGSTANFTISVRVNSGAWINLGSASGSNPNKTATVPTGQVATPFQTIGYYYIPDGTTYSAGDQLDYRISSPGNGPDPVIGDFAILGCCQTVPEPSTATSLLLGMAFLARRRRT